MDIRNYLLNRILDVLEVRGWSRRAFCLKLGIDHHTIQVLERGGNCTLKTMEKIEGWLNQHAKDIEFSVRVVTGKDGESFPASDASGSASGDGQEAAQ